MTTVLLIVHLFVTLALIGVVLIQRSEGGGLGVGTSQGMGSFMSGRGTANLLTRTTAILATAFFVLSMGLALLNRGTTVRNNSSILDVPPTRTTPALPAHAADPAGPVCTSPVCTGPVCARPGCTRPGRICTRRPGSCRAASGSASDPDAIGINGFCARHPSTGHPGAARTPALTPTLAQGGFTPGRSAAMEAVHDAVRIHHRRRGFLFGQRSRIGCARRAVAGTRIFRPAS